MSPNVKANVYYMYVSNSIVKSGTNNFGIRLPDQHAAHQERPVRAAQVCYLVVQPRTVIIVEENLL